MDTNDTDVPQVGSPCTTDLEQLLQCTMAGETNPQLTWISCAGLYQVLDYNVLDSQEPFAEMTNSDSTSPLCHYNLRPWVHPRIIVN